MPRHSTSLWRVAGGDQRSSLIVTLSRADHANPGELYLAQCFYTASGVSARVRTRGSWTLRAYCRVNLITKLMSFYRCGFSDNKAQSWGFAGYGWYLELHTKVINWLDSGDGLYMKLVVCWGQRFCLSPEGDIFTHRLLTSIIWFPKPPGFACIARWWCSLRCHRLHSVTCDDDDDDDDLTDDLLAAFIYTNQGEWWTNHKKILGALQKRHDMAEMPSSPRRYPANHRVVYEI